MNVLELVRAKGIDLKKAGSTHGGEWCSPCPGCGGDDRFRIWPEQNSGTGSFWCRGCGKAGDRVTFLMEFDGKSYLEACRALDIEMKNEDYRTPRPPGKGRDEYRTSNIQHRMMNEKKKTSELPADLWVEKAGALVEWAHGKLLENEEQLAWLADRGIDRDAVEKFRLGWNPGWVEKNKDGRDIWRPRESWGLPTVMKENKNGKMVKKKLWVSRGLVIPFLKDEHRTSNVQHRTSNDKVSRIRIRRLDGEPRYYVLPGSNMDMMVLGDDNRAFLVVESELDAIMCHAQSGDLSSVIALGSSLAKPDKKLMENLRNSAVILLAQDYDAAGVKAMAWWKREFQQAKTWPVPDGGDPGEAFQAGIDIRAWISAGLPEGWRVGQSLLDRNKKVGDVKPVAQEKKKVGRKEGGKIGNLALEELAGLLREHPVVIHNTPERTFIAASMKWQQQNWNVYKRISALVFLNADVFHYISAHPADKITGENINYKR